MGGTNLLLMTIGHISNVWSIKPNFKFETPKCDQNWQSFDDSIKRFSAPPQKKLLDLG